MKKIACFHDYYETHEHHYLFDVSDANDMFEHLFNIKQSYAKQYKYLKFSGKFGTITDYEITIFFHETMILIFQINVSVNPTRLFDYLFYLNYSKRFDKYERF